MRNAHKILVEKPEGRDHSEDKDMAGIRTGTSGRLLWTR